MYLIGKVPRLVPRLGIRDNAVIGSFLFRVTPLPRLDWPKLGDFAGENAILRTRLPGVMSDNVGDIRSVDKDKTKSLRDEVSSWE